MNVKIIVFILLKHWLKNISVSQYEWDLFFLIVLCARILNQCLLVTGSDLLSAITATFEEKMRSLQESPLGLVTPLSEDATPSPSTSPEAGQPNDCTTRGKSECRLYRDPSLHRRRTNPRNPSANTSTNSTAVNTTPTTTISQVLFFFFFYLSFINVIFIYPPFPSCTLPLDICMVKIYLYINI